MEQLTHLEISPEWVGEPLDLTPGRAVVKLPTRPEMKTDHMGLVHGGFTFGLADYAAMLAVNEPNVVLGGVEAKFLAPVRLGEAMIAEAHVREKEGKRFLVQCTVSTERKVFEGTFTCFSLPRHVLES